METSANGNDLEAVESEETSIRKDLAQLLDEHDYDLPSVGDIRSGIIVSISNQGIIVDLGLKRDGLVQPSDLDDLDDTEREAISLNDEVPVYIMDTSHPDRLLVSIKKAKLNQDWVNAQESLESGEVIEAPVIGHNRGGVIVPFGNLRGFVPASHLVNLRRGMDERQRQQVMADMRDETLPLKVIEVNRRRKRLVLSQRDAQKEWQETRKHELINSLNRGDIVMGRVSGLRSFGAFVDLGGADGLVHISELAWYRVNHPREVVKVGDEIEVYILGLDKDEQRIALSRKRLLANPWSLAEEKYAIDQLVEGKITRIVNYGAFVEVEPGIEGLLHISQLSRDTVNDPHEVVGEGETHLLRIISLDADRQRIGLSLKSVKASEQIEWMTKREKELAAVEVDTEEAATSEEDIEEAFLEPVEATIETEVPVEDAATMESASQAEMEAAIREAEEISKFSDPASAVETTEEE